MNASASRSAGRTVPQWRLAAVLCLGWFSTFAAVAQVADSMAPFPFQNRPYHPAPNPVPGVVGSLQPRGIAIFGGNVGPPGRPGTPNNGTYYLFQSGFGEPTAEVRHADFLIGEEIVPDPALQVDLSLAPVIDPPIRAFHVADIAKVFASERRRFGLPGRKPVARPWDRSPI